MRARRTDANHGEIARVLRECHWMVEDVHVVGGFIDLVATRGGIVRLIEVKTPTGQLTDEQELLIAAGWPIHILRSVDDAINLR